MVIICIPFLFHSVQSLLKKRGKMCACVVNVCVCYIFTQPLSMNFCKYEKTYNVYCVLQSLWHLSIICDMHFCTNLRNSIFLIYLFIQPDILDIQPIQSYPCLVLLNLQLISSLAFVSQAHPPPPPPPPLI